MAWNKYLPAFTGPNTLWSNSVHRASRQSRGNNETPPPALRAPHRCDKTQLGGQDRTVPSRACTGLTILSHLPYSTSLDCKVSHMRQQKEDIQHKEQNVCSFHQGWKPLNSCPNERKWGGRGNATKGFIP